MIYSRIIDGVTYYCERHVRDTWFNGLLLGIPIGIVLGGMIIWLMN